MPILDNTARQLLLNRFVKKYKISDEVLKKLEKSDDFTVEEILASVNIDKGYLKWAVAKSLNKDEDFAKWIAENDNDAKADSVSVAEEISTDYKAAEEIAKQVILKHKKELIKFNNLAEQIAYLDYYVEKQQNKLSLKNKLKVKIAGWVSGAVSASFVLEFVHKVMQGPTYMQEKIGEDSYYNALYAKFANIAKAHGFGSFDDAMTYANQYPSSKTAISFLNDYNNLHATTYTKYLASHASARFAELLNGTDGLIIKGLLVGVTIGLIGLFYCAYKDDKKYYKKLEGEIDKAKDEMQALDDEGKTMLTNFGIDLRETIEQELKPADIAEQKEYTYENSIN